MMAEYIDREALLEVISKIGGSPLSEWDTVGVVSLVANQPAADVAQVRRGKWEETDLVEPDWHGFGTVRIPNGGLRCSRCANVFSKKLLWKENYCPNCGAKMEVPNDD